MHRRHGRASVWEAGSRDPGERDVYLGRLVTSGGSLPPSSRTPSQDILKFVSLSEKIYIYIKFYVRMKRFKAALLSTILHGSEFWLNRSSDQKRDFTIKQLNGHVRTFIMPNSGALRWNPWCTQGRGSSFNDWRGRGAIYLMTRGWARATRLTLAINTQISRSINSLISNGIDDNSVGIEPVKQPIDYSASSRRYVVLNPRDHTAEWSNLTYFLFVLKIVHLAQK